VARIVRRSPKLGQNLGGALEENIAGIRHFTLEDGRFRTAFTVPQEQQETFQDLAREIIEWRLAEYLDPEREAVPQERRFVAKVRQTSGRPILFLPDREQYPELPTGTTALAVDGEQFEADFVKMALNVVRRPGEGKNELPRILQRWFGPAAGQPGTRFEVVFERTEAGWTMAPAGGALDKAHRPL
jgi:hypothetical protein